MKNVIKIHYRCGYHRRAGNKERDKAETESCNEGKEKNRAHKQGH